MIDRKKVILGLEYLHSVMKRTSTEATEPLVKIIADALALLKEQEAAKTQKPAHTYCPNCGAYVEVE